MPFWSLVPFLCALGSSTWVHYHRWHQSLNDIRVLATRLKESLPQPGARTTDRSGPEITDEFTH